MSGGDPRTRTGAFGLRPRVIVFFAAGAALVSLVLAVSVFTISRGYMVGQRERSAERQTESHVEVVRNWLDGPDVSPQVVLDSLNPPVDTLLLLRWGGDWYSSAPDLGPDSLPDTLLEKVRIAPNAVQTTFRGRPVLAVGIDLDDQGNTFFEFAPLVELQATLSVLRTVLVGCGLCATAAGALLGWWASRRVLAPLHQLADAAARISGGELDTRLVRTRDRDLGTIVTAFNAMVDSLQDRIERERRFFADVSHELRTPLTTLVTSVDVMQRHRTELPERAQLALGLVSDELDHLRRLLEHLLELARTEAGLHHDEVESLSLADLVSHTLAESRRGAMLLTVVDDSRIVGRKIALERALLNLMDNADKHGGGLKAVTLDVVDSTARITVDDTGPGVATADYDRVFERFVTAHTGRRSPTGTGTGLGLALVAETVAAHGGTVTCGPNPAGQGARFTMMLPIGVPQAG